MTPRKLTDSDKQEILKLYRQPGETTLTLANRYGVSNSTISRILKSNLSDVEYEALVQQKRTARFPSSATETAFKPITKSRISARQTGAEQATNLLTKKPRLRTSNEEISKPATKNLPGEQLKLLEISPSGEYKSVSSLTDTASSEANTLKEMFGEDLLEQEDFEDLEEDEEDEDIEDLEEEESDDYTPVPQEVRASATVQILPLSYACLPKTCYLVVDRSAELITRPLKDFAELGQIPAQEIQQKTLPVFDNHRVARRFSNRSQRVVKVPDGQMLQKTSAYLQAKGITRLLIDGQVYSI
ncbi:MAG: transposase [Oscillatoriaceae bacterium SKW80]|nr:transposase [Oscillatoriaceae bacterium SKYG93]MCX8120996.1 transposase [Oscillatoriaceae bacterium SKW80]MDW8452269.1 transposase [Oscillatoriaceae cyanobacterium SKYGB_i_bin93]HIK26604.1 transposase [Oscillatoriaceae cyanobacterium M7585_C2015_266]